jgi:hypothetical protein
MGLSNRTDFSVKTFLVAALWLPIFHYRTYAQTDFTLSGKVITAENKPVENCLVTLLNASNKSIVKTAFTDSTGYYQFLTLKEDTFKLLVSAIGYKQYESDNIVLHSENHSVSVGDILLTQSEKKISEVTVSATVPFIERKLDRTIINPEAQISNAGNNALEVLAKAPGIMVTENTGISLKGKSGVVVFVDDKPTYLSGAELEAYLKTIASSDIKQIEIMTNPPAKYEAAGNAGIINIKTKKSKQKGLNGTASINYGQGRYPRTSDNFTLNYGNSKIAFTSGIGLAAQGFYQCLEISRTYKNQDLSPKTYLNQSTYIKIISQSYSVRAGLDYYLNDKTTIGFNAKGSVTPSKTSNDNKAQLLNNQNKLDNNVLATNDEENLFINGTFNLNVRHQFDSTGKQIITHLDYVTYRNNGNQLFSNSVLLPDGTLTYSDRQNGKLPSGINIYALKCDYENPFKNDAKLDVGIKTSYIKTNNQAIYTITKNGITENNYDLTNQFKYNELINAAYANFTKSFKRFDLQGGLRFESTILNGNQLGNAIKPASAFKRIYNNLFPTFYASFKLDSSANHLMVLSYGNRIDRPFFKDLNPFVRPLDRYTYYAGNPFIQPTFTHNASLAYSFKNHITATFSYSRSVNNIQETIEINNGIYYSRPGNIGTSELFNLSFESSIPFAKWLSTNIYSEVVYAKYNSELYNQRLNAKGIYFSMNVTNSFVFKEGWSAELSGQFITDFIDSQFSFKAFGSMSLGVQKKILKDKGTLKLSASDVLYTNRIRGTINNLELTDAKWKSVTDSRIVALTFSYRFGNNNNSKPKTIGFGSDAEQSRVKK